VVFPAGFNKDLVHSNKAQVQIIADASDPNTGSTLANYATAIIRDYEQGTREKMEPPMRVTPKRAWCTTGIKMEQRTLCPA
jgi:ABC-2 type transport system permease protein